MNWDYRRRLRAAVASSAAAYGFTLTIWTSGAITASAHGIPATVHALVFAAGAVTAFAVIGLAAFGSLEHVLRAPEHDREVEVWGAFHLPIVGAAVGLATLLAHAIHNAVVAWIVVGFAATSTYLLMIALQYMAAERRATRKASAGGR